MTSYVTSWSSINYWGPWKSSNRSGMNCLRRVNSQMTTSVRCLMFISETRSCKNKLITWRMNWIRLKSWLRMPNQPTTNWGRRETSIRCTIIGSSKKRKNLIMTLKSWRHFTNNTRSNMRSSPKSIPMPWRKRCYSNWREIGWLPKMRPYKNHFKTSKRSWARIKNPMPCKISPKSMTRKMIN